MVANVPDLSVTVIRSIVTLNAMALVLVWLLCWHPFTSVVDRNISPSLSHQPLIFFPTVLSTYYTVRYIQVFDDPYQRLRLQRG